MNIKGLIIDNDYDNVQEYVQLGKDNIKEHSSAYCQHKSLHKVFDLFDTYRTQNNINYDLIVKSRLDVSVNNLLDYNYVNSDVIYLGTGIQGQPNDLFAISNYDIMREYFTRKGDKDYHYSTHESLKPVLSGKRTGTIHTTLNRN